MTIDFDLKQILWQQFGASIDMLENAINACPDDLWRDQDHEPYFWYLVSHTLFWLDLYLHGPAETFNPPQPFGLEELDPAGVLPPRIYAREELLSYLQHCREQCRQTIYGLNETRAGERFRYAWGEASFLELLLYNLRHVQHHTAQLNLILRQRLNLGSRWVGITKHPLSP